MIPVHLDDQAEADLFATAEYLANWSSQAAERFIQQFWSVVQDLRQFPELGQGPHREARFRLLRRGPYQFVYELRDGDVLLLRILDGRRGDTV